MYKVYFFTIIFTEFLLTIGINSAYSKTKINEKEKAEFTLKNISAIAASDTVESTLAFLLTYYKDKNGSSDSILQVINKMGIEKGNANLLAFYYL